MGSGMCSLCCSQGKVYTLQSSLGCKVRQVGSPFQAKPALASRRLVAFISVIDLFLDARGYPNSVPARYTGRGKSVLASHRECSCPVSMYGFAFIGSRDAPPTVPSIPAWTTRIRHWQPGLRSPPWHICPVRLTHPPGERPSWNNASMALSIC